MYKRRYTKKSSLFQFIGEKCGLGEIIRAACISEADAEKLLEFRRPAGDFDSKILLCRAFSLIHPDEAEALRVVQKIRNRAAHFDRRRRGFDVLFDSPQTVDQVYHLAETLNVKLMSREIAAVRKAFVACARLLAVRLYLRLTETRRPVALRGHKEMANEARERVKDTELGRMLNEAEQEAREGKLDKLIYIANTMRDVWAMVLHEWTAEDDEVQSDAGLQGG